MRRERSCRPRHVAILESTSGRLRALEEALDGAFGNGRAIERFEAVDPLLRRLDSEPGCELAFVEIPVDGDDDSALAAITTIRGAHGELPVIAVSRVGGVDAANRAIEAGATDFLVLGDRLSERIATLLAKLGGLFRVIEHKQALEREHRRLFDAERERYRLLGASPQMARIVEQIRRVAAVPRPVLIVGERGTGKELVARAIHAAAGPATRPFVAVNCAAFPENLLENELFGHERGAFTGADRMAPGRFEQASGGTLFLDEIGFMSMAFQKKILRVVEYGTLRRVGGGVEIRTDARIVAATNVDLARAMQQGDFLRDLYDRLAFEVLRVPSLREREGDIELLAREFLARFMREIPAFQGKVLSRAAIDALRRYEFPGNVRELKNLIERAAYRDTTNEITPADIDLPAPAGPSRPGGGFTEQVEALERELLDRALDESGGNQAAAARRLGLTYHQLRHYRRKHARR